MPNWTSANKLSGFASYMHRLEFDKDAKRFASGIPQLGWIAKMVKVYDPRLDSTYPGGSGAHRWNDESTFTWSENPALHALTYARGRFIEKDAVGTPLTPPVRIVGCGFPEESIKIEQFVELANLCEANGWTIGGAVYEGPGTSKWDNLKRMLQVAAADPVWTGGMLGVKISSPKVALFEIGLDDLADGDVEFSAMKSWRDRINTVVPRVRLENQKWEYVQLEEVTSATYVTEDGETKTKEVQFDLCQNKDQGAELAAYEVVNSREIGPFTVPLKPYFMPFRPGEAGSIDLGALTGDATLGEHLVVITGRTVDPSTGVVTLTLESETTDKHDFALGRTGVAPPTPTIFSVEDIDLAVGAPGTTDYEILEVPAITVEADYTGTVVADELPRDVAFVLMAYADDVTDEAAWSFSVNSGAITATIGAATGVLNITALGATSELTITADHGGIIKTRLFVVNKHINAPPSTGTGGGGGTTSTDSSFLNFNSTSMATVSDEITAIAGAAGEVNLSAPLLVKTAKTPPDAVYDVKGIWQWDSTGAGVWVDLGTEASSNPDCEVFVTDWGAYMLNPGSINIAHTKTGLTPSTSHKFRLRARNASGTRSMYFTGTASAVGS